MRYRVFTMLLDLDELSTLDRELPMFAHNRRAPVAFYNRDHGPATGDNLRPWVEARLCEAGLEPDGGRIRLLCYPRIFGYVFNPLSVYFCYRRDGNLLGILYEVCNTFGERHTYVIPVDANADAGPVIRQHARKSLYVSPFISMEADYKFRILPPGDNVNVVIRQEDADGLLLAAAFRGERTVLSPASLAVRLALFPLLTVKIFAGIHWEALLMWLKGFSVFRHEPAHAPICSSVGRSDA
jgi:DUF1365 family protein